MTSYRYEFDLTNLEVAIVLDGCASRLRQNRNHFVVNGLLQNISNSYDISGNNYHLVVGDSEYFLIDDSLKAHGVNIWDRLNSSLASDNNFDDAN